MGVDSSTWSRWGVCGDQRGSFKDVGVRKIGLYEKNPGGWRLRTGRSLKGNIGLETWGSQTDGAVINRGKGIKG